MLRSTFLHIPGITRDRECQIWQNNILNWDEFLKNYHHLNIERKEQIHSHITRSIHAYDNKDYKFFLNNIPTNEHWRAYKHFNCCFLDIETTGLSRHYDDITLIGLYDGKESKIFTNGINMDEFPAEFNKYDLMVTFNGKCFDVPFIKAKFPQLDFNKLHIDLRYAMRELGYMGGLKRIEKEIGITREEELQDISGFEAVRLWYKYLKGDDEALRLLIKYNKADIENLKVLMDFTFEKLKEKHFHSVISF